MIRSRFRSVLVAVVSTLAIGALSASVVSSASAALPEFTPIHDSFTGNAGGVSIEAPGGKWNCQQSSITGEVSGAKALSKVFITFSGCTNLCSETFKSKELKGRLGYTNQAKREVAVLLEPVTGTTVGECKAFLGRTASMRGSVIGKWPERNRTKNPSLVFSESLGKQNVKHFEGEETNHFLEIAPTQASWEEMGLAATAQLAMAEPIEVSA